MHSVLSELDSYSDLVEIYLSQGDPVLRVRGSSPSGKSSISVFKSSDVVVVNNQSQPMEKSSPSEQGEIFKYSHLIMSLKCMAASAKTWIKMNKMGNLSLENRIPGKNSSVSASEFISIEYLVSKYIVYFQVF